MPRWVPVNCPTSLNGSCDRASYKWSVISFTLKTLIGGLILESSWMLWYNSIFFCTSRLGDQWHKVPWCPLGYISPFLGLNKSIPSALPLVKWTLGGIEPLKNITDRKYRRIPQRSHRGVFERTNNFERRLVNIRPSLSKSSKLEIAKK